jgi:CheY-like chemotaxis protein
MSAGLRKLPGRELELARVLLVDDDVTSRLTLQTVLRAGGYVVDAAASAAEAVGKLDERQYELVLSDLQMESPEAGLKVLAHARLMDYKPATAILTTYRNRRPDIRRPVLIKPEDLPGLLGKVADLISQRAARMVERQLKQA